MVKQRYLAQPPKIKYDRRVVAFRQNRTTARIGSVGVGTSAGDAARSKSIDFGVSRHRPHRYMILGTQAFDMDAWNHRCEPSGQPRTQLRNSAEKSHRTLKFHHLIQTSSTNGGGGTPDAQSPCVCLGSKSAGGRCRPRGDDVDSHNRTYVFGPLWVPIDSASTDSIPIRSEVVGRF